MTDLTDACTTCNAQVGQVFDPNTGTRQLEIIAGDLVVTDQCFVRDEIRFVNQGRLIFAPRVIDQRRRLYFEEYFVICRKLTVIGGHGSGGIVTCSATDPGTTYQGNNVIIWQDRLKGALGGTNFGAAAAAGTSFTTYQDNGQGNDGQDGGKGADGSPGNTGASGQNAPRKLVVIVLEVDVVQQGLSSSHLTIDWGGQNGGNGGRGQNGGDGGQGMNGKDGATEHNTWSSDECDSQPGNGGNGGAGGNGGHGGGGGGGGNGGAIAVISTQGNISTGSFANGDMTYVFGGGLGGTGSGSGVGGRGNSRGGKAGRPAAECGDGSPGLAGADGVPNPPVPPPLDQDPNAGATGATGGTGNLALELVQSGTCADRMPLPITPDANGLQPIHYCRGFSTAGSGDGVITGVNLAQVSAIAASLAGVTATKKPSSTDTELDLAISIAGNSATGTGNIVLTPLFGAPLTMNNAIQVDRFNVNTITPNTGVRGGNVDITIAGTCFDGTAAIQTVDISGVGVTAVNIVVVDANTMQCTLTIAAAAATGARNVTVKTGTLTHTLVGGFTVT